MDEIARHRYPVAVETLYAILTSRDFFQRRFCWGNLDKYRFEHFGPHGDTFLIRIVQPLDIPADKVPSFARRFLPSHAELSTEFAWRPEGRGYLARYQMALGNVPVKMDGSMRLLPDGADHARQETRVSVHSSVPLVGRKLEALVAERFDQILDGDYRHTKRYIEEVRTRS